MTQVKVTNRDGSSLTIDAEDERPLMESLRAVGVEGTCGGECSCGTCHVYVAVEWAERLPTQQTDERDMLGAIAELVEVRPNSRLSCQILVGPELAGLSVEIAPQT
jgi:ferredoxin, 2Fe-2S